MMDIPLDTPMDRSFHFVCAMCAVEGEAQFSQGDGFLGFGFLGLERECRFTFNCTHCGAKVSFVFSNEETFTKRLEEYRKGSRVFLVGTLKHSEGDDVGVPVYEKGGEKIKRHPVMIVTAGGDAQRGYLHTRCIKSGKEALIASVVEYDCGIAPEHWEHSWAASASKGLEED